MTEPELVDFAEATFVEEDNGLWRYYRKCLLAVMGHLPEPMADALGDALYPSDEAQAEDALNRLQAYDRGER